MTGARTEPHLGKGAVLPDRHARQLEQGLARRVGRVGPRAAPGGPPTALVLEVHDLADPALDDELGALIAGEHGDVDRRPSQRRAVLVHNGIHLRVANVRVLRFEGVACSALLGPGKCGVAATSWKPIIANAQNNTISTNDDRANLRSK